MKPHYIAFNAAADTAIGDSLLRSRILAAGLALAMANTAELPSSMVENPSLHFSSHVQTAANGTLSAMNEALVFDCKAACEQLRGFWLLRYTAAHPVSRPVYTLGGNFFESICGAGSFLAPEVLDFINANHHAILMVAMAAAQLLEAIKAENA